MLLQCVAGDADAALAGVTELWDSGYSALDVVGTLFRVARGLDESDLARLRPHLRDGAALDDAHRSAATWMLAQGARVLRRVPAVSEASQLLSVLRGERDASSPAIVRWERALRISGRCEACAAMALSQVANE